MERVNVGLVIAKEEKNLDQLIRFSERCDVDLLVFPEGYISSNQLYDASRWMKARKKWLVTSMEDKREKGFIYQTGVVMDDKGEIVGEHKKTSITDFEKKLNISRGDSIEVINTDFGKIGLSVCFELFFPEVTRIYALNGARIIFNPIGTGMWDEKQYLVWNAVARARAAENGVFVLGCSHYNDGIPMAFAYAPDGECLVQTRDVNRMIKISLELDKYKGWDFEQRRADLYKDLTINS